MKRSSACDIVLVYHRPILQRDAATVVEDIAAYKRYSRFRVWELNTALEFPAPLRGLEFPAIVLHYSLFGVRDYPIPNVFLDYVMACASSYKIAFFQDEYQFCRKRFDFARAAGIDCIYSLLESELARAVYGPRTDATDIWSTVPGYVSDEAVAAARVFARRDAEREIDVGYRGRELSPYMGRAAREKTAIAERFLERARGLGLTLDIETGEGRRLYGSDWHRFLGNCRACLGVEAGVSVFDLEGVVYARYEELRSEHPAAGFDEMAEKLAPTMDAWEDRIYYRTISPRHFEAAAFQICQVLYEGRYSGILDPMRHYIPLRKDFSNFDDVVHALGDSGLRRELTEAAHADLVASGDYSYRSFIRRFDENLLRAGLHPARHTLRTQRDRTVLAGRLAALSAKGRARVLFQRLLGARFPGRSMVLALGRPVARMVRRFRRPSGGGQPKVT